MSNFSATIKGDKGVCGAFAFGADIQTATERAIKDCESWGDNLLIGAIYDNRVVMDFSDHINGGTYTVVVAQA